jgi:hypothetical protein
MRSDREVPWTGAVSVVEEVVVKEVETDEEAVVVTGLEV